MYNMYSEYDFDKFLFFDLETVPEFETLDELKKVNEVKARYWIEKRHRMIVNKYSLEDYTPEQTYIERASLYPEFNKIISVAFSIFGESTEPQVLSYSGNELELLKEVAELIQTFTDIGKFPDTILWGYYSNRFDVPVLYKHMLINHIELPDVMVFKDHKPWEIRFKDIYDIWNILYGEKVSSLDILANLLNVPSSKNDIDGSDVYNVYYVENDIERIANYCEKDSITTLNILRAMCNLPIREFEDFDKKTQIYK